MEIEVSKILPINNLNEYKIHFAVWNGDEQPLDVFVRDRNEWKGWNSWRGSRDDFSRKFIFSLIRYYHQPDKWLFGGIFQVVERNPKSYTVNLADLYQEYIGRLLVHYPGPGVRGRAFYLENHFSELKVAQVLEKPYEGEAFCGYENVEHGFSQLEAIVKQGKNDWKAALENVKGVYLIVDRGTGKMYVGSAYGDSGIWSRWACYIGSGHVHHMLPERVRKAVEKAADILAAVFLGPWVRLRDEVITAGRDVLVRWAIQIESERGIVKPSPVSKNETRQRPEALADSVKLSFGIGELKPQPLMHILVKGLKQLPARVIHSRSDLLVHLLLQLTECGVDLFGRAALLVDSEDALFEIHAGLDGSKYLVGGAEDSVEEAELLAEELENAAVGFVALV